MYGETDDRPIADRTLFVHDSLLHIDRRISAGQRIPRGLEDAYADAVKPKAKPKAQAAGERTGEAAGSHTDEK